jgi:hypothetical protein
MRRLLYIVIILLCAPAISHGSLISTTATNRVTNGLVGYWTFDGSTIVNGVAQDQSGQGNHGNFVNIATTTAFSTGKIGQGILLDGGNDAITLGSATVLDDMSAFSVSMWLNTKGFGPFGNIVAIKDTSFNTVGWRFLTNTTKSFTFEQEFDGGTDLNKSTATNIFSLNKWVHVVLTYDGSNNASGVQIYVDGVDQSSGGTSGVGSRESDASATLALGATPAGGGRPSFAIYDDVRVYNRVITASEVQTLFNLGSSKANTSLRTNYFSLYGYWTFDPADLTSTTTVYDRSRKGYSGTSAGFGMTLSKTPGKLGEALVFDGTDDTFSMGDVAEPSTITLAAWVKPSTVKGGMKIISKKMSGASSQYGLGTHSSNTDKFTATFFSSAPSSDVCTSTGTDGTYAAHKWYYVVATYDGDTCKIYVNGVDVTSVTSDNASGNILNTTSALRIGAEGGATASGFWTGALDEVRIFGRALTAVEVQSLYAAGGGVIVNASKNDKVTNGLVGLWSFDGPDMFTNVRDGSGQGNHGNLISFGATSTVVTPGRIGQGLKFDGSNDYIESVDIGEIDSATALTVCAWVQPNQNSHDGGIVYKGPSASITDGVLLFQDVVGVGGNNLYSFFIAESGGTDTVRVESAANSAVVNKWAHLCGTYLEGSASGLRLYLDGSEVSGSPVSTASISGIDATTNKLWIGDRDGSGNNFSGKIDDVRIYNRVLSASEVTHLYNLGR